MMAEAVHSIFDRDALQALVDTVSSADSADRLDTLKAAITTHGGRWDLPSEPDGYHPVLMSAQIFGICAFAQSLEELPVNWLHAARNALAGE